MTEPGNSEILFPQELVAAALETIQKKDIEELKNPEDPDEFKKFVRTRFPDHESWKRAYEESAGPKEWDTQEEEWIRQCLEASGESLESLGSLANAYPLNLALVAWPELRKEVDEAKREGESLFSSTGICRKVDILLRTLNHAFTQAYRDEFVHDTEGFRLIRKKLPPAILLRLFLEYLTRPSDAATLAQQLVQKEGPSGAKLAAEKPQQKQSVVQDRSDLPLPSSQITPEPANGKKKSLQIPDHLVDPRIFDQEVVKLGKVGEFRLKKIGGGAIALVFKGVDPDDPGNPGRWLAVKIADSTREGNTPESLADAMLKEYRNLTTFAKHDKKGYFPRVFYPSDEAGLAFECYMRANKGWGWQNTLILAMEWVDSPPVRDVLLDYSELALPEPLGIAILAQYADAMATLEEIGITCADRKLGDLHWAADYYFNPQDKTSWEKLRQRKNLGHLKIFDWNVTSQVESETDLDAAILVAGNLFFRMVLREEPRFHTEGWRLEKPFESYEYWERLSYPTRRILQRFFPENWKERYTSFRQIKDDVQVVSELFCSEPAVLVERAKLLCGKDDSILEDISLAADYLSIVRNQVVVWGQEQPAGFEEVQRMFSLACSEVIKTPLREYRWETIKVAARRLAQFGELNPALTLLASRVDQLAEARGEVFGQIPPLEQIAKFTVSLADSSEEKDELTSLAEKWQDNVFWGPFLGRLLAEAEYLTSLKQAEGILEIKTPEEVEVLLRVLQRREDLAKKEPAAVSAIDQTYGNPIEKVTPPSTGNRALDKVVELVLTEREEIGDIELDELLLSVDTALAQESERQLPREIEDSFHAIVEAVHLGTKDSLLRSCEDLVAVIADPRFEIKEETRELLKAKIHFYREKLEQRDEVLFRKDLSVIEIPEGPTGKPALDMIIAYGFGKQLPEGTDTKDVIERILQVEKKQPRRKRISVIPSLDPYRGLRRYVGVARKRALVFVDDGAWEFYLWHNYWILGYKENLKDGGVIKRNKKADREVAKELQREWEYFEFEWEKLADQVSSSIPDIRGIIERKLEEFRSYYQHRLEELSSSE